MGERAHFLRLIGFARDLLSRLEEGWVAFLAEHKAFELDVSAEKVRELAARPERQQFDLISLFPAEKRPALHRLQALPDELKRALEAIFDRMTEDENDRTQVRAVAIESVKTLSSLVFLGAVRINGAESHRARAREEINTERQRMFAEEMATVRDVLDAVQAAVESRVAIPGPDRHGAEAGPSHSPEVPGPAQDKPTGTGVVAPRYRPMTDIMAELKRIAPMNHPILFVGERGTGKSYLAEQVHELSGREGDCVHVSCPALSKDLFEREMFGHVEGAFSGASKGLKGLVKAADNGTLFLDEVSEITVEAQATLLQLLQEEQYRPVGSTKAEKATCRFVLATNRDLAAEIREGKFRADLYDRVSAFAFRVPPLRERRDEIPDLVGQFQGKYSPKDKRRVNVEERRKLRDADFDWPGNVRMLENAIKRAFADVKSRNVPAEAILAAARESMP